MSALKYYDNVADEWKYVTVPLVGQPTATYSWPAGSGGNSITAASEASRETLFEEVMPNTAGQPIEAIFDCSGYLYAGTTSDGTSIIQLEYSTDGGTTWSDVNSSRALPSIVSGVQFIPFGLHTRYAGTPTSDLRVRLTGWHYTGDNLSLNGDSTEVVAQVFFNGPSILDNRYQVVDDTGWITLTKDSGWGSGDVNLRKRNGVVVLDFSVTIGTTSSGTRLTNIPAEHRASITLSGAAVSNSGGGVILQCIIESDGDVIIYYPAGPGSANVVRGNFTWMID